MNRESPKHLESKVFLEGKNEKSLFSFWGSSHPVKSNPSAAVGSTKGWV